MSNMKGKIFNAQEVQAMLNRSKVMFREVIKPAAGLQSKCPYKVGQEIFCKETFAKVEVGAGMGYNTGEMIIYRAADDYDAKWKPAQHMKQEHSRITLQIKSISVERLSDISEEDAIKEGCSLENNYDDLGVKIEELAFQNALIDDSASKTIFASLWNATHKKPEEKFKANPWVWVVEFEVI